VEWTLRLPSENLDLHVVPLFPNQELDVSVRYWEGAVRVEGPDGALKGRGYVELTGYGTADPPGES
jgi:predicted secreted hydrolase